MRICRDPGDLFCNSVLIVLREVMRDYSSAIVWERWAFQACRCWYLTLFDYSRGSRQRMVSFSIKWQVMIYNAVADSKVDLKEIYDKRTSFFQGWKIVNHKNQQECVPFYIPSSLKVDYNFILLNLMTQKLPPLSREDLLSLVRGRKFKEYPRYIREIQNMTQAAQQSVSSVLKSILVDKTEKDPTLMLNALVLYKYLMISACFDYSFTEDYFPQSVHAEVIKICQYKPNIQTFSSRGSDYFSQTLKIPKTEQNKDMLERTGNSYVLMALELVQAMAAWYPNDYSSPKTPSYFKSSYEELLKKRVTFPNKEQQLIIKKTDEENFKSNYEKFKKRMQELDQAESNSPQKKPPPVQGKKEEAVGESKVVMKPAVVVAKEKPPPNSGNTLNIAPSEPPMQSSGDMLILRGEMTSAKPIPKNPPKDPPKKQTNPKDPSMIVSPNIFATNELPQSSKTNPTLSKQGQKSEVKKEIKQEREVFKDSDEQDDDMPMPKESSARFGKIDDSKAKIETKPNNPPPVKPQEEPKPKPAQVVKPPQPVRQSVPNKPPPSPQQQSVPPQPIPKKQVQASSVKPDQPVKKPEKQQDISKPQKEEIAISVVRDIPAPKPSPMQSSKKQPNNSMNIKPKEEESIGSGVFSFTQKDFGHTIKKDSLTPRKIAKMEKGGSGMTSLQMSPNNDPQSYQPLRPKSLPKTERTLKTAQNFFPNKIVHLYKGMDIIEPSQSPTPKGYFNKTLSDFAKNRPKHLPSKQLQKAISLQGVLNDLKLDLRRVPFISQYYEPITRSMRALRGQSLTLFNSGTSSNQFFANGLIECRLVKQGDNTFSLMLQNVSSQGIIIEYCQMKSLRYSNRIKILSWANRPQISPYEVPRKGFMDIRFRFSVGDLNFKFLSFLLRVNGKVETLVLPVTLLDMCEVSPQLPDLYKFSLNGSIIASEGFVLGERGLPHFLGGFRFTPLSNSRGKHERGQVIGQGCLRWEGEDGSVQVGLLVRVAEWQERRIEVNVIHEVRRQESEDLAKVILYLLVFLLEQD